MDCIQSVLHILLAPPSFESATFIFATLGQSVRLFYQGGREGGREGASARYVAILGLFVEAVRQPEREGEGERAGIGQASRQVTYREAASPNL